MRKVTGFTIIELVVVIAILGILAAVALPRFIDLQADARAAAVKGVAGAVASGAAINYAAQLTGKPSVTVSTCTQAGLQGVLLGGAWPDANITVADGSTNPLSGVANGEAGNCDFQYTGDAASLISVGIIKSP